jgi:acetolactate synthase small subunit
LKIDKNRFDKEPKKLIKEKEKQMNDAVKVLDFETAAILRDEIKVLVRVELANHSVVKMLYTPRQLKNVVNEIHGWRSSNFELFNRERPLQIEQCNLQDAGSIARAAEMYGARDAVISNFSFQLLTGHNEKPSNALERLAPLVRPGGIMVLAIPAHFMSIPTGPGIFQMPSYKKLQETMVKNLSAKFGQTVMPATVGGKSPTRVVDHKNLVEGSPSFEPVNFSAEFQSPNVPIDFSLRTIALIEAMISTREIKAELSDVLSVVSKALDTINQSDVRETAGIYVGFYVFTRK